MMPQNQFCHPLTRRFDWKKLKAAEHPYDVDQLNILSFPFIPTFGCIGCTGCTLFLLIH